MEHFERSVQTGASHFVVVAHGRSGSTMLSLALAAHPNVAMFLEIFHRDAANRKRYFPADECRREFAGPRGVRRRARVYEEGEDPAAFLAEAVFYPRRSNRILAVGFKLLHNFSILGEAEDRLWSCLRGDKTLRIIDLRRKDLVAAFVSHEIARRTGKWTYFRPPRATTTLLEPFTADVAAFDAFTAEMKAGERLVRSRFGSSEVFEVTYEDDMGGNFGETSRRLQEFLRVPFHPLPICTLKTPTRPLETQVLNLAALRSRLAHSTCAWERAGRI